MPTVKDWEEYVEMEEQYDMEESRKKVLNKQKERAQNIIYSGDSIQNVWRYLGQVFNQAKINAEIPRQMLQLPKE